MLDTQRELPEKEITLPYDQNFVSFDFVAIDFHSPEKLQYAYQLENFEQSWTKSGSRRYVSYTNLPPGEYTFRVKAASSDGVWNESRVALRLIIRPPWWQTWWAYIGYGLVALGLLYAFRQYTLNRERLKNDLKVKQLEADKLQELDGLRSRFFANISHEFRTPLTLILAPLENLLATPQETDKHPIYQTMQRNTRRLLSLINQLLDLSKLEAGSLKLEPKPGNIIAFLKTLATSFASVAQSRQITFSTQFPEPTLRAKYDPDKLEKIVVNLLSNAFKFTPDGGVVTFQVNSPQKENQGNDQVVEIIVADSGIGIEADQLEKIFDRFYQVDSSQTREREGTGIGLALTKELVELHGGQINVESQAGAGTTFTVQLPLLITAEPVHQDEPVRTAPSVFTPRLASTAGDAAQMSQEGSPATKEANEQNRQKPILLIVEDNQELSDFVAAYFHPAYQVLQAANGKQGLQKATQVVPDLVISDVMMPVMDGITLSKQLKSDERTSHIPLILLTAKATGESKLEGLETGADDYLTKPFSGAELQVRVKNLIEGRKRLRERFSRQLTLQPTEVAITSADGKFLQRVKAIVEQHLEESDFSLEAFEKEVGLSHVQFYRKLKALTDQAPGEFLRNYRLQKAAMLLKGGHGNVSEVAYAVGFNSLAYFTRCFKVYYGKSPSEYLATGTTATEAAKS